MLNLCVERRLLFVSLNIYFDLWTQVPLQYLASRSVVKLLSLDRGGTDLFAFQLKGDL